MKIKTKIRLGLIFLLAIIIALAVTGSIYVNKLADISAATLNDNYETLEYTKNMIQALDDADKEHGIKKFDENLRKQENNITEIGEGEATKDLRDFFEQYRSGKGSLGIESALREKILHIQELNMNAIVRKNGAATLASRRVFSYITILGTLSFLLSFTFVVNFPGMIANPIAELTAGIKEIAQRNYSLRLNFQASDEFGEVAGAFNNMAQRLDEYENSNLNKLMFEKKRIEAIINNMRDAIIGLDESNKILFANGVAIQLLGLNENDIIGKYAPDAALRNDLLRNLLVKEEKDKLLKIYADNKESYFSKEILEIFTEGNKIGEVIILRNITKFQELDFAKTNFIATISHELKTPIAAIKMSLKLLEDKRVGELNEEQTKLLDNIKGDSQRLLKIAAELLDITQVESGNIHLTIQNVQPLQIIEQAISAVRPLAEQKNIQLQKHLPHNFASVKADLDKTSWVLINFLTNAIRYSDNKSSVVIDVQTKDNSVYFAVQDFGKGIDPEYQSKVFEKFFQVPGSKSDGSGMGLAISKEVIEKEGGKIGVSSEVGKGSTFWFELQT